MVVILSNLCYNFVIMHRYNETTIQVGEGGGIAIQTNGLILAAGLSSRMGEFAPLMPMEGRTLIENSIDSMLRAGMRSVTIVLGYRAVEVELVLRGRYSSNQVKLVRNDSYGETDMLHSVKIGIRTLPKSDSFFLLPGDMPAVRRMTFQMILAAMEQTGAAIAFPTLEGRKKHPPLIAARCIPEVLSFEGNGGLRELWKRYEDQTATVSVEDLGCDMDTDTVADYEGCIQYMAESRNIRLSTAV